MSWMLQRIWRKGVPRLFAAALVSVGAAHAAGSNCQFSASGTLSLAFGDLDPSVGASATATLTGALSLRQFGDCKRGTFTVQIGNGSNYNGVRRLKHQQVNDYIPYQLNVASTAQYAEPGNGNYPYTLNFTGTIQGTDFVNATAGGYNDTIVVNVNL